MKKLLFICKLISLLCVSCQQKKFDLADLRFPIDKKQLNRLGVETNPDKTYFQDEAIRFISDSSSVMHFGGIALAGNLNRYDKNSYASNTVTFLEDPADKTIQAYKVTLGTSEETEQLEHYFDKQFGKTDFYYKDTELSCRVWEKEGLLFYLGINFDDYNPDQIKKHRRTALLFVVNKSCQTLIKAEAPQGHYFQFYHHYLQAKQKPEYKTLTYRQYMESKQNAYQSEDFETIYAEHYVKQ